MARIRPPSLQPWRLPVDVATTGRRHSNGYRRPELTTTYYVSARRGCLAQQRPGAGRDPGLRAEGALRCRLDVVEVGIDVLEGVV
eukprot:12981589-Heterocapsa_arctica.AAC.1